MKKSYFPLLMMLSFLIITSCQKSSSYMNQESISEQYIHQYGMPISYSEWEELGKTGEVVSIQKNGTTVKQNYVNGILHGTATESFPYSKRILKKSNFTNGVLTEEISNYENDLPAKKKEFLNNDSIRITEWYLTSVPKSVEIHQDNRLIKGEYMSTKNELLSSVVDGYGIRLRHNSAGDLISEDKIENGSMIIRTTFYSDGTPHIITPYLNNKVHGEKRIFMADGQPEAVENWLENIQTGVTTRYKNGAIFSKANYTDNLKHGIEQQFDEDGNVIKSILWAYGLRNGPSYRYIADKTYVDWFLKGKQVSKLTYEESFIKSH